MLIDTTFLEIDSRALDNICNDLLIDVSDLSVRHVVGLICVLARLRTTMDGRVVSKAGFQRPVRVRRMPLLRYRSRSQVMHLWSRVISDLLERQVDEAVVVSMD